jgi:hypothetical protein
MRTFEINWESEMAVTYVKKEVNDEKLTIRLSPQLKYTVELLSRRMDESTSAVIKEAIRHMTLGPDGLWGKNEKENGDSLFLPDACWDPLDVDRFVKLAIHAPELLNNTETVQWKVISEEPKYYTTENGANFKLIRDDWELISAESSRLIKEHG